MGIFYVRLVVTSVLAAAVVAAFVTFFAVLMVVMVALDIRVEAELTLEISLYSLVTFACYAAEKLDACACESSLSTSADTAADKHINAVCAENTCESAVTFAVCADNFAFHYLIIFDIIELELGSSAEMLENISIFISYCNSHFCFLRYSFLCFLQPPQPHFSSLPSQRT